MNNKKLEYILLCLILAIAGFEFLYRAGIILRFVLLVVVFLLFLREKRKFNYDFFLILIPFVIPLIYQAIKFDLIEIGFKNVVNISINFLLCYLILDLIKEKFHITYVNLIFFLSIISLIFYPSQFFPSIQEFIKSTAGSVIDPVGTAMDPEGYKSKTLIFFTFMHNYGNTVISEIPRNCGAFWEPGLFAVFLNLALLINLYVNNETLFSRKNVVFIITILTTLSTAGYIALFIIFLSIFLLRASRLQFVFSLPVLALFLFLSVTYVWKLDFISQKIDATFEARGSYASSRFGAVLYHIEELKKFPLAGTHLLKEASEINLVSNERESSPNGLSLIFFFYGIPAAILYFILFYKGLNKWLLYHNVKSTLLRLFFYFIFLLLAFSQDVTNRPFYLLFLFFTICLPKSQMPEENIQTASYVS
jgi:hypothetical protein